MVAFSRPTHFRGRARLDKTGRVSNWEENTFKKNYMPHHLKGEAVRGKKNYLNVTSQTKKADMLSINFFEATLLF